MAAALPKLVVEDNPTGWGPCSTPAKFQDIPYAPFSKSDKLGRNADWAGPIHNKDKQRAGQQKAFQTVDTVFKYAAVEDDDAFSLVDRVSASAAQRAKFPNRKTYPKRPFDQPGANAPTGSGKGPQQRRVQPQRYFRQEDRVQRILDPSVTAEPTWTLVQSFTFAQLLKLQASELPEAVDLESHGTLRCYDRNLDRLTVKTEKRLPVCPESKMFFSPTTTEDPVLQRLAQTNTGNVFATDSILAVLMCTTRSVNPWDILVHKIGNKLFFDKRDNIPALDLVSVNENSPNPPPQDETINSATALAKEATLISRSFSQFVLAKAAGTGEAALASVSHAFANPGNPHSEPGDDVAPIGYRYRKWALGDDITLVARADIHAFLPAASPEGAPQLVAVHALTEYDSRVAGTMDWRQKLDTQRGAVFATELRNNSNKLAKWTAEAAIAGVDQIRIGYVARTKTTSAATHDVLGVQTYRPKELEVQTGASSSNMWGIVYALAERLLREADGKYILVRDAAKPLLHLYALPADAFEDAPDSEPEQEEDEPGEEDPAVSAPAAAQGGGDDGDDDDDDDGDALAESAVSPILAAGKKSQALPRVVVPAVPQPRAPTGPRLLKPGAAIDAEEDE